MNPAPRTDEHAPRAVCTTMYHLPMCMPVQRKPLINQAFYVNVPLVPRVPHVHRLYINRPLTIDS